MNFFEFGGICDGCKKKKFFVSQRTYSAPKISREPIISNGRLCHGCYKSVKKVFEI